MKTTTIKKEIIDVKFNVRQRITPKIVTVKDLLNISSRGKSARVEKQLIEIQAAEIEWLSSKPCDL